MHGQGDHRTHSRADQRRPSDRRSTARQHRAGDAADDRTRNTTAHRGGDPAVVMCVVTTVTWAVGFVEVSAPSADWAAVHPVNASAAIKSFMPQR